MEPEICADTPQWWAMSAVYNRSLVVASQLSDAGIGSFVPMHEAVRQQGGRRIVASEPAVRNLIFVRACTEVLKALKAEMPHLQYLVRREGQRSYPIIINDVAMDDFIRVSRMTTATPRYFTPDELSLTAGSRVRIIGGELHGICGTFVRVKGTRSRRLVILLDGVLAIAAEVSPDLVEVL